MKKMFFIFLLIPIICSAQSPYEGRTPKGEVITSIQTTAENRLYQNQNKSAMKKFEYRTNVADFKDIQKNCNQLGALGWELVAVTPIVDTITFLLVFKIEIIE
jgi:hypothetical protein